MPSSYSGRTSLLDPSPRHVRELPMDAAQAPAGVVVNIEALAGRRGSNAPAAPKDQAWKKFLCHVGPGFMVSLFFLDPRNLVFSQQLLLKASLFNCGTASANGVCLDT
ncbi:uncharacterized protein LOC120704399 [Panicum virgatum]|uniref:Uncharacterized protein n=1 Tax=Panicum virgatum TaxID=38727 RepID=A0A8T0QQ46_PANVG|nr:uncharacterized protein LOC120641991 [Panicum virgatum]XP_039844703.1 uncharacterized protein LOC120704399 [Panicum virgatum]KAG2575241.1 hypothetical protein PVAP13_7KG422401 [Panicum virgatum]